MVRFSDEAIDLNWEGAVLKQLNAPWIAGPKSIHAVKRVRVVHNTEDAAVLHAKALLSL